MHSFLHPNLHYHSHVPVSGVVRFIKNWTLPIAIAAGIAGYFCYTSIPWLDGTHALANKVVAIVQPTLIFSMLFLTFLSVGPRELRLRRWHLWHLLIQLSLFAGLALLLTLLSDPWTKAVVECAMLCLLCPTATAAPVVTRKLGGSAADITAYTILINLAIAVAAPTLLPIAHPHHGMTFMSTFAMIMLKVFPLLICPLLLAWAVRAVSPRLQQLLLRPRDLPFYLWALALAIAIAVTVKAIVHSHVPMTGMIGMVVASSMCCMFQFYVGKLIGKRYGRCVEGGQALGQKNTVFIIWMGYTFLSPVTAVAGGLYSVWHNVYNSYQLYRRRQMQ